MALAQLLLICLVLGAFVDGRFIVDLTHTFDKDATKYPLGTFAVGNFTYFKFWSLGEQFHERNNTDDKMW